MSDDDYEILPHKEIEELKKELESLKDLDVTPTRKLHVGVVELNRNISKLLDIFEQAMHEIKIEEGGITFAEKIKPLVNRLDKIERNMETMADVLTNVIAPALTNQATADLGIAPPIAQAKNLPPPPMAGRLPVPPPPK
jgi:hypothetical protein